jgi:hypothetical protein
VPALPGVVFVELHEGKEFEDLAVCSALNSWMTVGDEPLILTHDDLATVNRLEQMGAFNRCPDLNIYSLVGTGGIFVPKECLTHDPAHAPMRIVSDQRVSARDLH